MGTATSRRSRLVVSSRGTGDAQLTSEPPKPVFGKYQVQDLLGEGGMGRVWRAFDPDLEVPVAIKELKEQFRDQANLERFFREAQIAAKCRHQNIVLITDLSKTPP